MMVGSRTERGAPPSEQRETGVRAMATVLEARGGRLAVEDLEDLSRLLTVTEADFGRLRERPWFVKAWKLASGERGRLMDRSVQNLSRVQVAVLRVLGELLEDSGEMKRDLVRVLDRLDRVEATDLELKRHLLAFNEKYRARFHELHQEVRATQSVLRTGLSIVAAALIAGATFAFVPGLERYWAVGAACWGAAALALLWVVIVPLRPRADPIPVSPASAGSSALAGGRGPGRARQLLGFGGPGKGADRRVFRISPGTGALMDHFTLDPEEQRLLFSLQHRVVQADVASTSDARERRAKRGWLEEWGGSVSSQLARPLVTGEGDLVRGLAEVRTSGLSVPKLGVILLETRAFTPYFSLSGEEASGLEADPDVLVEAVQGFCGSLGFGYRLLDRAWEGFERALKEIPPGRFWRSVVGAVAAAVLLAVTGGLAAPALGAIVGGAMGLSGAAAVSAGLAFLGGGAIAAGGLGVAGGTAVVIGGGAVLGAAGGGAAMAALRSSHSLVLRELAKLEAVASVYLPELPDGDVHVRAVAGRVRGARRTAERELRRLDKQQTLSPEERAARKEIAESLPYYERSEARLKGLLGRAAPDVSNGAPRMTWRS